MSELSGFLRAAKGEQSIDDIAAKAQRTGHQLSRSTVAKYLRGEQGPRASVETLDALAAGFGVDPRKVRRLAGRPAGELGEWSPPDEAKLLTKVQREALDQLIRVFVAQDGGQSDGRSPDAEKNQSAAGEGATVTELRPPQDGACHPKAARKGENLGKQLRKQQDEQEPS